jgi:hypothetical protein
MIRISFVLAFVLLLTILSCHKPESKITYPSTFDSKLNILQDSDFVLQPGRWYSLAAYLPEGCAIKVVCKPTNGKDWGGTGFLTPERIGYKYHESPDSVMFEARGEDDFVNVDVTFGFGATTLDINIYENNAVKITRQKTVKNF